jgi:hypothetical protein
VENWWELFVKTIPDFDKKDGIFRKSGAQKNFNLFFRILSDKSFFCKKIQKDGNFFSKR